MCVHVPSTFYIESSHGRGLLCSAPEMWLINPFSLCLYMTSWEKQVFSGTNELRCLFATSSRIALSGNEIMISIR